jgi:hypothetical protein
MLTGVRKAARQPLVQFLVLGAVLFGLWSWLAAPEADDDSKTIVITAADVSRLDASFRARWNRPPTEEELLGLVRDFAREKALYRHALAMGLDRNDPTIERMLSRKLQALTQNLVELSLSPTEQDLRSFYESDADRYRPPSLITFTQVFVDPDQRGDGTLDDAKEILDQLRSLDDPTAEAGRFGDPFMLQRYYPAKSQLEISKLFGKGFTESAFALEPGVWHGPLLSGYGVHLVYVHHLETAPIPEFETVEKQVRQDWMDVKRGELEEETIDQILSSYTVVFEESPQEASGTTSSQPETAG